MDECIRSAVVVYHGSRLPRAPSWFVRWRYETHIGPIPRGFHVHHT